MFLVAADHGIRHLFQRFHGIAGGKAQGGGFYDGCIVGGVANGDGLIVTHAQQVSQLQQGVALACVCPVDLKTVGRGAGSVQQPTVVESLFAKSQLIIVVENTVICSISSMP